MARPDDNERDGRIDELERDVELLRSRLRILEGRLQDRAITISDTKGKTRRVRLGEDDALEVE